MKIAVITDDGQRISQHFGRAPFYLVATIENGQITKREMREKLGHVHFANEPHEAEVPGQQHGFGPESQNRHARMAQTINDCEAVLCRGMGMGAYESLKGSGIRPVVTDIELIEDAINAYIEGTIEDHIERLH
jgi:predicted Fe-Mo cluster-binding NifX family protein